ncbi:MAG: glycosyl transferase [Microbacterium sp.]|uniref:glycosyl transferase n=1 Tax=Microbacterium sp. TaxID=51671 RepID=UPI001ACC965B|nr:glycosyl transferase [Microbacterium sp.]MBN9152888.1 glycosyl transferase [Microbacterium sp.]
MRFVWAVAAFVLAALMIATGIAQRTVFQGPKSETATIKTTQSEPYTLIDGAVLNKLPGAQTLRAHGDGTIFVSYGRTADMTAWLADTTYNHVTVAKNGKTTTTVVEPDDAAGGTGGSADSGDDSTRSPINSDLWLDEFQQDGTLEQPLRLPATMSVLVASDGSAPAPSDVTVTWPLETSTPWAGPLMVGGGILMLVGVFLYILGIRHARRSRGPRRKALPPLPETEPIDIAIEGGEKGVISAGRASTRRAVSGRKAFAAIPVVAVSALLLSGCSADAWPQFGGSPTPTPTATIVAPEGQQPPAVTATQADRILGHISTTVASADEKRDQDLAATRLTGAALAERVTNYTLRGKIADYKALPTIPAKGIKVFLPQAYEGWPRTVMLIAEQKADKAVTSTIMMITQSDPWSNYRLAYVGDLEATQLPNVAPDYVGASAVPPDSSFLVMPPEDLAKAYADIITRGDKSTYAGNFDAAGDQFRASIDADRKRRLAEFNKTASTTGRLTFSSTPGAQAPLALATLESGAIVAVNLNETDTVTPTSADAVIKLTNNPTVKALAGVDQSQTGFTTTYSDQLFFYVPGQGSGDTRIRLLGFASNILGAKAITK